MFQASIIIKLIQKYIQFSLLEYSSLYMWKYVWSYLIVNMLNINFLDYFLSVR